MYEYGIDLVCECLQLGGSSQVFGIRQRDRHVSCDRLLDLQPYQGSMRTSRQGMVAGHDSSRCATHWRVWSRLCKHRTLGYLCHLYLGVCMPNNIILFVCLLCIARDINMDSENATLSSSCQSCFSCCYSIALLGMYVYGLVVFANREVEGPWKDYQGNTIMCPLI